LFCTSRISTKFITSKAVPQCREGTLPCQHTEGRHFSSSQPVLALETGKQAGERDVAAAVAARAKQW
jgi:hypothetical protein